METLFNGLSEIELIKLINKKKNRWCAIGLQDLDEMNLDEETRKQVRKILLDSMNGMTRGVFSVVGIEIEGSS